MKSRKKTILSLVLTVLLVLSMGGCQSKKNQGEINSVNKIIVGEAVTFASYDPMGIDDGQGFYHYSRLVYETLVKFEDGEAIPGLAQRWESDGNTWTFYLRDNVTFTDGAIFNAEAVKLNFEKLQEFKADSISYYGGVSRITSMEVLDEYIIRLNYDNPYYAVLQDVSAMAFGMLSPSMFKDGNNPYGNTLTDTTGTGPYVLKTENLKAGISYTFVQNKDYYNTLSGPEQFTVKIIPDADSRMMAMQSGEIDLLYGSYQITHDMFDFLKNLKDIKAVKSTKTYATRNLLLNSNSKILSDIRIRQAISYGINKEQIINTVLHSMEQKANTLFANSLPYCDIDLQSHDYDSARAVSLLDEAGWIKTNAQGIRVKDGVPLQLEVIYMSERYADEQILMAFKGQMAEIGIDITISGYETMTWFEKGLAGEFDITVNDTYGFPQDPHVFVAAMLDYGLDNPAQQELSQKSEIDSQIRAMLNTTDEEAIKQAYTYILTTLQDETINIPVSYLHEIFVFNSEKIESASFSDDPAFCDISKINLK